ncbi:MAG: GNAT family N-acetyltransferase [Actinobacteria bacterium]|nr:GNAT family N-acetyltransferase [Actinomycetota bacterium]
MGSSIEVRGIVAGDREGWERLWLGYAAFYRAVPPAGAAEKTFRRLRDEDDGLFGLVAADDGQLVGLVHLVIHSGTWPMEDSCYLQDLYVDPAARGTGVADRLFESAYAGARERGASRVYWHTQQFNGAARSLYDSVGRLTSMIVYEHTLDRG